MRLDKKIVTLPFAMLFFCTLLSMPTESAAQWPVETGGWQNLSTPVVGDVNGDGLPEILFTSWDGYLYCTDLGGNILWKNNTIPIEYQRTSPTLADVDGDPSKLEIIVGTVRDVYSQALIVLDGSANILARFDISTMVQGSPLVMDSDRDGLVEIYFGDYQGNFYALNVSHPNNNGDINLQERWRCSRQAMAQLHSIPAGGDLDGDGILDIVFQSASNAITAVSNSGKILWTASLTGELGSCSPVVADLDGDGNPEVLIGTFWGYLYCFDGRTGNVKWTFHPGEMIRMTPAAADIDGDGVKEVIVGISDKLYILDKEGKVANTFLSARWDFDFSSPVVGDIDADGSPDILIGTAKSNRLLAINADGTLKWEFDAGGAIYCSPSLADLDGNGGLEVLFGVYSNRYHCLDNNGFECEIQGVVDTQGIINWPMKNGNIQSTRSISDIVIGTGRDVAFKISKEKGKNKCSDGIDNDLDGLTDAKDPDCLKQNLK